MLKEDKYFQTLSKEELWQRYCGFLDLSIDEFMEIQEYLLLEQIDLVVDSPLGKKIMNNRKPKSMEEFRQMIPLTTYDDYESYLSQQREDVLADKTLFWCHSAGRGGKFKWIPYNQRITDQGVKNFVAILTLATAQRKGNVAFQPGHRMLLHMAPRPYVSGAALYYTTTQGLSLKVIPPLEEAEKMEFPQRIALGFRMALRTGLDEIFSIASVLVKVGEKMAGQAQRTKFSPSLLHPAVFFRLLRALVRKRLAGRAMLPRDLWQTKAIITIGADTTIYKADIAYYWGQLPYEIYGGAEAFPIAIQAWNKKWLTFVPDIVFFEFIPEEEREKAGNDPKYQPATVLLNEVTPGKSYEVVFTQLYGMPLLRYRVGDIIKITASADEEAGINLPQMIFKCRADEIINLAGLAMLDEKTVWQAIANSGVKYEEWTACKEFDGNQAYLRLYLELKESRQPHEVEQLIDTQLKAIDTDYGDLDSLLQLQPVRVTLLSRRTFERYFEEKRKEGADLAHLKPKHINASDAQIQRLLQLSNSGEDSS